MTRSEGIIGFFMMFFLLIIIGVLSYYLFFQQMATDKKAFEKINISYDVAGYEYTLNRVSEFLVEYPNSTYRAKVLVFAANILYKRKDFDRARDYVRTVVNMKDVESEDFVDAVLVLGKILKASRKTDSVTLDYLHNAYLKAGDAVKLKVAYYLGYAHLFDRKREEAIRYFNEASGERAVLGRADVYIADGDFEAAIREYENFFSAYRESELYVEARNSFLENCFAYGEKLKESKEYNRSVRYYLKIPQHFPSLNFADAAYYQVADIYYINKNYTEALRYFKAQLDNMPDYTDDAALFGMAMVYYETDRHALALKSIRSLEHNYPESSFTHKAKKWLRVISGEMHRRRR